MEIIIAIALAPIAVCVVLTPIAWALEFVAWIAESNRKDVEVKY